jgi:hypothetical protein
MVLGIGVMGTLEDGLYKFLQPYQLFSDERVVEIREEKNTTSCYTRQGIDQLRARRGFIRTSWWMPAIAQRRPHDQIRDHLRPALLALRLEKDQRGLDLRHPAGRHRDQQMPALPIL